MEEKITRIPIISHETFKKMIEPMIEAIGDLESDQPVSVITASKSNQKRESLYENLRSIYDGIVARFDEGSES